MIAKNCTENKVSLGLLCEFLCFYVRQLYFFDCLACYLIYK